ncbi:hypothetical protein [Alteromonas lipolytica]|uniref:Uncharacterized protein n=1 Tax=Alteromonas lipolytica TaxID=1856405 RepID=A0A1E8FDD0_9ALTE|nr:hypothetical protein [Alteromonas lipolytica]OFI33919.1 hypothetical protein BFC17_20355 [Alteromonas lipolytica]GGF67266.1 hypothetical protein GCM10011338_19280 [Alteromonas lipolytica]
MTLVELLGHYSLAELENYGKEKPAESVHIKTLAQPTLSLISTHFHASQFLNVTTEQTFSVKIEEAYIKPNQDNDFESEPLEWETEEPGNPIDDYILQESLRQTSDFPSHNEEHPIHEDSKIPAVNPCTGFPEIEESGIDAGGHVMYSSDDFDVFDNGIEDTFSSFDDPFHYDW